MLNGIFCGSQVMISPNEPKDGSGGPPDDDDLESGDVVYPGDTEETDKSFPEPRDPQPFILVPFSLFVSQM